jgi:hypothetical protein
MLTSTDSEAPFTRGVVHLFCGVGHGGANNGGGQRRRVQLAVGGGGGGGGVPANVDVGAQGNMAKKQNNDGYGSDLDRKKVGQV